MREVYQSDMPEVENMLFFKRSLFLLTVLFIVWSIAPAWAKKDLPAINDEGMELVRNSELATVYADPGADLGIYKRIWLEDATVAFRKNWKSDQDRVHRLRVKDSDMLRITEDVATLFREVMTKELIDGGYEMTDEEGEDVLIVRPAIVDLDVHAPDIQTAGRTAIYSRSAGEMTLNLELFDSVTGDKIARATDRQRDYDSHRMEWRTKVSNRADARRMMQSWARALRSALDEARSATSGAE